MDTREPERELIHADWELFILLLSLLSLVNIIFMFVGVTTDSRQVILIIDGILCLFFLADFAYRLLTAPRKMHYMAGGGGTLDFFGSFPVPGLRLLRISRIVRGWHTIRKHGGRRMLREYNRSKASGTLLAAIFLTIIVLEVSGVAVLKAEDGAPNANITTGGDALWWAYVTVTTVGYGDEYPVTAWGRIVGVALLTVGVALFATITGFIANVFLDRPRRNQTDTAVSARREGGGGGDDPMAAVDEVRRLLLEHEQASNALLRRLEALEERIGAQRVDAQE